MANSAAAACAAPTVDKTKVRWYWVSCKSNWVELSRPSPGSRQEVNLHCLSDSVVLYNENRLVRDYLIVKVLSEAAKNNGARNIEVWPRLIKATIREQMRSSHLLLVISSSHVIYPKVGKGGRPYHYAIIGLLISVHCWFSWTCHGKVTLGGLIRFNFPRN